MTLRYRTPRAGAALTLLWGLMMTTPAFAQPTRDTLGFNGAGADTGVAEPAGPPGERWSLARAVAAALEGSVDARAAHARTLQARGSALSAWSGIRFSASSFSCANSQWSSPGRDAKKR